MKFKKLLFSLVSILSGIGVINADDRVVNFVAGNAEYHNPTPGRISIVAVTPIPSGVAPTKAAYREVVDCGFNIITVSGTEDYMKQQFNLTDGLDLKLMVGSGDLRNDNYKKIVNAFKNQPRLAAWNYYDEPRYADLATVKNYYEKIQALDPSHLVFINLIGAQNKLYTGPTQDYTQYLNLIQKTFHPSLWSYDLYPFSTKNLKLNVNYDLFYYDLETVGKMSRKTSRPFWAFCQSMGFRNHVVNRPSPKEEYLRFAAFSALGYGAQGIVYWTYAQRKNYNGETYSTALVDVNGKKTTAWAGAKRVNDEIKKFNDIFYGCNVQEVKHTGKTVYKGTTKLTGSFGPFRTVSTGNSGAQFSRIQNGGKEYIVIVNHDVISSQGVKLTLSEGRQVTSLTSNRSFSQNGNEISFQLEKGGYAIFRVN